MHPKAFHVYRGAFLDTGDEDLVERAGPFPIKERGHFGIEPEARDAELGLDDRGDENPDRLRLGDGRRQNQSFGVRTQMISGLGHGGTRSTRCTPRASFRVFIVCLVERTWPSGISLDQSNARRANQSFGVRTQMIGPGSPGTVTGPTPHAARTYDSSEKIPPPALDSMGGGL